MTSRITMFWVMPSDARSVRFSQFFIAATRDSLWYVALALSVAQSLTRASPRRSRYRARSNAKPADGGATLMLRRFSRSDSGASPSAAFTM